MRLSILWATVLCVWAAIVSQIASVHGEDWPMWRHDAQRSAASDEQLADELHLHWWRDYPPLKPAWMEDRRLQFDAHYEPIVAGGRMYLGSSRNDSVTAIDATTGMELWKFFADGPVRFAPVAIEDRVYFGSDDGHCYCVSAEGGELLWKYHAAPNPRHVLGNERLISAWPVRGGPVADAGKIYFTFGVWPFEGTFLVALDATTGQPVSSIEHSNQIEVTTAAPKQNSPIVTLRDRSPQGYLAISGNRVLIPCGRAVATCFDRQTGDFTQFQYSTSRTTNYHVCSTGSWLFHGKIGYHMESGTSAPMEVWQPVLTDEAIYYGNNGTIHAYDLSKGTTAIDRRGQEVKQDSLNNLWSLPLDIIPGPARTSEDFANWIAENPLRIDLKAGTRIYGHQRDIVFAIELPVANSDRPRVVWQRRIDGNVATMIAADGRLHVVTREGRIYCFGESPKRPSTFPWIPEYANQSEAADTSGSEHWLQATDVRDGYCLVLGVRDGNAIEKIVRNSEFHVIAIDADPHVIDRLRTRLDKAGLYGERVALINRDPTEITLSPYLANLVVSEDWNRHGTELKSNVLQNWFDTLRPYGGTALVSSTLSRQNNLADLIGKENNGIEMTLAGHDQVLLQRKGELPGSANWTHEYGDPANTLMSIDERVKAPLGVLWFGGPSSNTDMFYNRHYWGPSLAVVDGRMFIQGPSKLSAVDIYTGRVLWKLPLVHNENYNAGRRGNDFEQFLAGFHFVAVSDSIYLVLGDECLRIDPKTGNELGRFTVFEQDSEWGRPRVQGDLLLLSIFRDTEAYGHVPVALVALDRYDGSVRWKLAARLSFPLVAVSDDTVYCFDGALDKLYRDWERRGLVPEAAQEKWLKAYELETGRPLWETATDRIVTWLGYSESQDVLVASNQKGITALRGEDGAALWDKESEGLGFKGHPENLWDRVILWNDRLIDQRGPGRSYDLLTGEATLTTHPITEQDANWEFTREGHHCNYVIANPHLLTFRSESAGFCDIATGQSARLNGFRSGCRNSLIPAGGILNAPNFAHGCVCGYELFTSLALVHRPETEMWTYSAIKAGSAAVKQVGVNFAAAGDRVGPNGVLWLDYPNVGGSSPDVPIHIDVPDPKWFNLHSAFIEGDTPKFVSASGMEGAGTVRVHLAHPDDIGNQSRTYSVSLYFVEPSASHIGQRVFNVDVEGRRMLQDFDIFKEAEGRNRPIVKRIDNLAPGGELEIALSAVEGQPLIAGIEIVAQGQ